MPRRAHTYAHSHTYTHIHGVRIFLTALVFMSIPWRWVTAPPSACKPSGTTVAEEFLPQSVSLLFVYVSTHEGKGGILTVKSTLFMVLKERDDFSITGQASRS